jgi:hypothetical protein
MSTATGLLISLAIGLLASLLWVLGLFCIKPRLKIEVQKRGSKDQPAGGWAFNVTNTSLVRAVQVQARLWHIEPEKDGLPTRTAVELKIDTLFQLNGRWASAQRTPQQVKDHVGSNSFRFLTEPRERALDQLLSDADHLLFQVWALHGFTNFGRVSTTTATKAQLPQTPSA